MWRWCVGRHCRDKGAGRVGYAVLGLWLRAGLLRACGLGMVRDVARGLLSGNLCAHEAAVRPHKTCGMLSEEL
jgi:hypothetical protein